MSKENKTKSSGVSRLVLLIPGIAVFIVIVMILLRTFVISVVVVNGGSMEPEMKQGEKWLVNRLDKDCEKNDIIVYQSNGESRNPAVSRVIASAGDTVYIDFSSGSIYVNGEKQNEPYVAEATKTGGKYISDLIESGKYGMNNPIVVESGKVFVMGDNRNNSRDSREFGQISEDMICGTIIKKLKQIFITKLRCPPPL